jgi:hypothetical protein
MCFAILYVVACLLLTTGQMGMSDLCSFSCAFSVGGEGFFWVRCFMFCLGIMRLYCCSVFCTCLWCFSVGSLCSWRKLLFSMNVCTFELYYRRL